MLDMSECSKPQPLNQEISELLRYREQLMTLVHDTRPADGATPFAATYASPAGMATPFATIPCNRYLRLTEAEQKLPAPEIPRLHELLLNGLHVPDALAAIPIDRSIETEPLLPIPRHSRCRVISPMYTVDVEEDWFSTRTTAAMYIFAAEAVWEGWARQLAALQDDTKQIAPRIVCQPGPLQASVIREGFMLQFMAWSTGVSWVAST
jgi:hypothetical protein